MHFGRPLFEPSIASTTSRAAIEEMAEHFGMAEFVVQELDLNTRIWTKEVDASLLERADEGPQNPLDEAFATGGTLTEADLWQKALGEGGRETAHRPVDRPAGTNIGVEATADGVRVWYGFRLSFWVCLVLSVLAALIAVSALGGLSTEVDLGPLEAWLDGLPAVPVFDDFVPKFALGWLIAAAVVGFISSIGWLLFVRRIVITSDAIRVYRGLRPFARWYSRGTYGTVVRLKQAVYIGKKEGFSLINVTVSPNLSEEESRWIAWELQQALERAT